MLRSLINADLEQSRRDEAYLEFIVANIIIPLVTPVALASVFPWLAILWLGIGLLTVRLIGFDISSAKILFFSLLTLYIIPVGFTLIGIKWVGHKYNKRFRS
ncbi:MAG: hypothetical protein HY506_00295 [Candidatus Yanofskybacteria bacterium]|nr:hypothetical protein [Candidatus Yanofskybacteria bacterium]